MSDTQVPALDHTVHQTNVWLKKLTEDHHLGDRHHAYNALRAVLHVLRDRLTPEQAVHLGTRLLLMRRDPRTGYSATNNNLRLLGGVVPDIDAVVAKYQIALPSPANPILPHWLRPALLAAVSIVERQGPTMLAWLQSKTIGQNRARFSELASAMLSVPAQPEGLSLLQHI
jgi:uncharacterized protein (DUF2267 family)